MKFKLLLPSCVALILALGSCKKESTKDTSDYAATFELAADQSISDNTTQDANEILNETAVNNSFMGSSFTGGTAGTSGILACATVTVTVAPGSTSGFPKNVLIDFGTQSCTSPGGITHSGKINVSITDSLRRTGSVATMTFDNYYVNGFRKEGTITWTNTSTATTKSWHRVCISGKITAPGGNYWTHSGAQDVVQTQGASTPLYLLDDVFLITGGHTVTNPAGVTRTGTILTALEKKTACAFIDMGTYKVQGPNHFAIIDYGNGSCDDAATISIDGQTTHNITLH